MGALRTRRSEDVRKSGGLQFLASLPVALSASKMQRKTSKPGASKPRTFPSQHLGAKAGGMGGGGGCLGTGFGGGEKLGRGMQTSLVSSGSALQYRPGVDVKIADSSVANGTGLGSTTVG